MSNTLTSGMPDLPEFPEVGYLGDDVSYGYDKADMSDFALEHGLACFNAGRAEGGKDAERYADLLAALNGLMNLESRGRVMPIGSEWDAARAVIAKETGACMPTPPAAMTKEKP